MTRGAVALAALTLGGCMLAATPSRASDPTTADCLAAAEASLNDHNEHRLRAERTQDLVCGAASCPADIRDECTRRLDVVNAAIPTIVFEVKDAAGNDLSAVRVTMDRDLLTERLEGTALSIDPGVHTFTFEAPGSLRVEKRFVVIEAQKERRELIRFGPPSQCPDGYEFRRSSGACAAVLQAEGCATGSEWSPAARRCKPTSAPSGPSAQQIAGLATAGVGVVGLGLGSAFLVSMLSERDEARQACPNACATQGGVELWRDAVSKGNLATAFLVAGGVTLAAGAAIWWTGRPAALTVPAPQVGVGPEGVSVRGSW